MTPHAEWFGAKGSKPVLRYRARGEIAERMQLDGTVGRSDGVTPYSVGVNFRF